MTMAWTMPYGQLGWLRAVDEKLARKFFDTPTSDTPTSYVVGNSPFPNRTAPWTCQVMPVFYSFEKYSPAGATMTGAQYPVVCYDPEGWPQTHIKVKEDPRSALWHFTVLAHDRGQQVVAAPSRDLIYTPGSVRPWQAPEDINAGYLRCQIPAAAEDADILVVQNQGAEKDTETYARVLLGANKQSPPDQQIWGGLTTNFATAAQMRAAYDAAELSGVPVTGYWLTIASQAQAPIAADFFRGLT